MKITLKANTIIFKDTEEVSSEKSLLKEPLFCEVEEIVEGKIFCHPCACEGDKFWLRAGDNPDLTITSNNYENNRNNE